MALAILFVGDSHLARLRASAVRIPVNANLRWDSMRGGGLTHLQSAVENLEWDEFERVPDIVVVFIGGNDLDRENCDAAWLAAIYAAYLNRLADLGARVMVLAQWPRPGARIGGVNFITNVRWFEERLKQSVRGGVWLWQWDKGLRFNSSFYASDGVHCARYKYKKVARYLSAACIAAIRNLRWWTFY